MDLRAIRKELEKRRAEGARGFQNKAAGLRWANEVAPLLEFKPVYHTNFILPLHELHGNLSSSSIESRWLLMLSQVDRAIADLKYREAGMSASTEPVKLLTSEGTYVDSRRLDELASLESTKFDLTKLIALLWEINACHQNQCYFAVAALVRTVMDHVPPIFGCKGFAEIANNYQGTKSFKESMTHLATSARRIGDQHLHSQIRASEILPSVVQVNFSNDLDVLVAEIVRVLKR
jgi:hypothetical protein